MGGVALYKIQFDLNLTLKVYVLVQFSALLCTFHRFAKLIDFISYKAIESFVLQLVHQNPNPTHPHNCVVLILQTMIPP